MKKNKLTPGTTAILGIPFDDNSSYLKGSAGAPAEIRNLLHSDVGNWFTEDLTNLKNHPKLTDRGDLNITTYLEDISNGITKLLEEDVKVLSIGGDHSITFPVIQAYSCYYKDLNVVHFDAHPDLYPELLGNPYSHACPFSRILEAGLVERLVQIGIRAVTEEQRSQAEKYKVEQIDINTRPEDMVLKFTGPVYISLDLDGIDPAFAPGVSHPEPGGLSVRDIINILHSIDAPIVGADIVEYNPVRDTYNITASVAVKLLKEIAGIMVNS